MTTRRAFFASVTAAVLAAPAVARAKGEDRGLLELLVAYSGTVVFAYGQALQAAPLSRAEHATLVKFAADVGEMDDALRQALVREGGKPVPRRPLTPVPPADRAGTSAYVSYIVRNEEILVSGWYAGLQKLADPHLVEGAVAYMAAGGRRLVVIRKLAGLPLLPRAFENGAS